MSQNKNSQIIVNLEPAFLGLVSKIIHEEGYTLSGYGRSLIIADLTKRNMLTAEIWQKIQAEYVPKPDPAPTPA